MSVDVKQAIKSLGGMSNLKFFPSDPAGRAEIVSLACRMAATNQQIDWLAQRCIDLWNEWEGPREFRAVFCSKFRPADGIECFSKLPEFLDGIPSESSERNGQITGGDYRQLTGDVAPDPVFPRDGLDLLHEAIEREKRIRNTPLPSQEEIDRIKAEQERNRRESK